MLICLVTLELVRPLRNQDRESFAAALARWQLQRKLGRPLSPAPGHDQLRTWRDLPESRDWEVLAALKQRDGWSVLSHRREFLEGQDEPIKDCVELAA